MWEVRDGRRYYYRWIFDPDCRRYRHVYVGTGNVGERAEAEDDQLRLERMAFQEKRHVEAERWMHAEKVLDQLSRTTEALARSALLAAGYYQHDRGPWRRRRNVQI